MRCRSRIQSQRESELENIMAESSKMPAKESTKEPAKATEAKPSGSKLWKVVKVLLLLAVVAVVAFVAVGMFVLDGKYELERGIVIKATPEVVHRQVGDLREWPNWLPFTKHDKSVKTTIAQPTG